MAASDVNDGPVMNMIHKRLRALRKKHNRILQMEEALVHGKPLNKEQEDVLRSKPSVLASIDELEKLCAPLSVALSEEISIAVQRHQVESTVTKDDHVHEHHEEEQRPSDDSAVEDLLNLLYFSSMFDAKSQTDFTATMLTRTHERGCCLSYDYVTDDESAELLGERDLDLISILGNLLTSRPVNSSVSHKNALQSCIERAKLWLSDADEPISSDSGVTYAGLRAKLNKIMSSDYFTTTPEMKATVEVAAAAAGNYGSFQGSAHCSVMPVSVPVQLENSSGQYQYEEEEWTNSRSNEGYDDEESPTEDLQQKGESGEEESSEVPASQVEVEEEQNMGDMESEEQFVSRGNNSNYRGGGRNGGSGGGGRRGYSNGRGGRIGGRGGGYRNGHNQYHAQQQPGNYYPRNNYYRGRGGRGAAGNFTGMAVPAGHA